MKYIVWDWNGTLLDDVPTCVQVMDGMLAKRGLSAIGGAERYREIFTFPVSRYYEAAGLDFAKEPFEELAVEFIEEYNRRALDCGLCAGGLEALEAFQEAGCVQVLASASEKRALEEQVAQCGVGGYFAAVLGVGDSLGAGKGGLARDYLAEQGARLEDVVFIGDTVHDWEVASGMGCRCVLVATGHHGRKRLEETGAVVAENLMEAVNSVLNERQATVKFFEDS